MDHITSEVLQDMFSPKEVIDIVKDGIISYAEGKITVPERMHISRGESTNLIMPAYGQTYYCTKLISVDPNNPLQNLPVISGILVLNKSENGETLMTMDAPMITALRTAAIGSIGLDLIYKQSKFSLGIIGLGVQGYWQALYAIATKEISEIHCYSRSQNKLESFQKLINKHFPTIAVIWQTNAEKVVEKSNVIMTCTTSKKPVFDAMELDISNKRFVSVGSFTKEMQELPSEVFQQADALIIDSESAQTEVGDVINALKNGWISKSNIYALSDVLIGNKSISHKTNAVFKSVGMAAFDLALAISVYENLTQK